MSEHDSQAALFGMVAYDPRFRWLFAVPNGGARNPVVGARMKREGTKRGIWDVAFLEPRGGYHGLWIEMKHGRNKLTPEQAEFGEYVRAQGYATAVCYSADDAYRALVEYAEREGGVK